MSVPSSSCPPPTHHPQRHTQSCTCPPSSVHYDVCVVTLRSSLWLYPWQQGSLCSCSLFFSRSTFLFFFYLSFSPLLRSYVTKQPPSWGELTWLLYPRGWRRGLASLPDARTEGGGNSAPPWDCCQCGVSTSATSCTDPMWEPAQGQMSPGWIPGLVAG